MKKTVMIMVDGFGIPAGGWFDSVYTKFCKKGFTEILAHNSVPVSSDLGISGIPRVPRARRLYLPERMRQR